MASFQSEDLNEMEVVSEGPTRLTGYSFKSTGTRDRYVEFFTGNQRVSLVVVPAGGDKSLTGLNEPYPNGMVIESRRGDGTLIAEVFYESSLMLEMAGAEG